MTILILCAGDSKRFSWEGRSKHRLIVYSEELLTRMVRQCSERGEKPTIVTHRPEILRGLVDYGYSLFDPQYREYTCDTLRSTSPLWDERVTVLLGDVIYSDELLNEILLQHRPIMFWGSQFDGEIYSLSFTDHSEIIRGLFEVKRRVSMGHHGQLWQLFYSLNDLCPQVHPNSIPLKYFSYVSSTDITQDFDSVEDYEKFIEKRGLTLK